MRALTYCYIFVILGLASAYSENLVLENYILDRDLPWYQVNNRFKEGEYFSGFRQTTKVEFDYSYSYNILDYTEEECAIDWSDYPITGRLFVASNETDDGYFYYCPKNKSILILEGDYLSPVSSIAMYEELPQFNWTKFYTNGTNNGIVYILGVQYHYIDVTDTNNAYNFTASYIITFNGNEQRLEGYTHVYTSEGGILTDIAIVGNTVYAISQSVYTDYKYMDLYNGTLGVEQFTNRMDYWYSDQLAIFPDLQLSYDRTWIVYSSNTTLKAIYLAKPGTIYSIPASSTLYAFNSEGSTLSYYIPLFFKTSNITNSVFVYIGPTVTQYTLNSYSGFVAGASYQASTGTNDYDTFARRIFYFQSTSGQEWILVSAGERAPSLNIINFSQGGLIQALPTIEANATLYNTTKNHFYIAKNGIYTLSSSWEFVSFQFLANFVKIQDSTSKECWSMMGGFGGNCVLTLWNSTANTTTDFLFPQIACFPGKNFNTSYNPSFPNIIEMFVGPLFRPIVGTRMKTMTECIE